MSALRREGVGTERASERQPTIFAVTLRPRAQATAPYLQNMVNTAPGTMETNVQTRYHDGSSGLPCDCWVPLTL